MKSNTWQQSFGAYGSVIFC